MFDVVGDQEAFEDAFDGLLFVVVEARSSTSPISPNRARRGLLGGSWTDSRRSSQRCAAWADPIDNWDRELVTQAPKPEAKPSRMARVAVGDHVWADFRTLAEPRTISAALGELVEREVGRHRAQRLEAGNLDDSELADALDRARELHDQLAAMVARLERRLDHQPPAPVDPGR